MARVHQAAVIPYRIRKERVEVALVTTSRGKGWKKSFGSPPPIPGSGTNCPVGASAWKLCAATTDWAPSCT